MIHFNLVIITTNHIYIGAVHIMSGLIGGSIGFGLSIILRLELALPGFILCSPLQYNSNIIYIPSWGVKITTAFILIGIVIINSSYFRYYDLPLYSILHVLVIKIDFYLTLSIYYELLQNQIKMERT